MVAWSDSVASDEKEVVWRGLKGVHTISVGCYDNLSGLGENNTRRLAAAKAQNWVCPLDGHDLRTPQKGAVLRLRCWNPLIGLVDWYGGDIVCKRCRTWLRIDLARCEEDAQLILNCASLAELQRVQTERCGPTHKRDIEVQAEATDACPMCDVELEHRQDGVKTHDHVKKQNAARTLTPAMKSFMSLKDFDCICSGCYIRIGKM